MASFVLFSEMAAGFFPKTMGEALGVQEVVETLQRRETISMIHWDDAIRSNVLHISLALKSCSL